MSARTRLNGWKEIAAHFGKGVRTVQRWEQVYGLPVRRVSGEGGEIVFAFAEELDAWEQNRRSPHPGAPAGEHDDAGVLPDVSVSAAAADDTQKTVPAPTILASRRTRVGVGVVVVFVLTTAAFLWSLLTAPARPLPAVPARTGPERVVVEGDRVRAFDAGGTLLWERSLGVKRFARPPLVTLGDLDGDGMNEAIVRVSSERLDTRAFVVLAADGRPLITRLPSDTVHFGTETYSPPWLAHASFVTENHNGAASLWLAFTHSVWFPEIVERFSPDLSLQSRYVSNGFLGLIEEAPLGGTSTVFIGATNNESRGASLALFDAERVEGSAPAESPEFRCSDCPPGGPREFLVFPRSCIDQEMNEQPGIDGVRPYADGRLTVIVQTGDLSEGNVYYEFGPRGHLLRVEVGREFKNSHLALERAGRLDHRYQDEDFSRTLQPVRRWADGRFVNLPVVAVEKP
jgi:hypothetical protein